MAQISYVLITRRRKKELNYEQCVTLSKLLEKN